MIDKFLSPLHLLIHQRLIINLHQPFSTFINPHLDMATKKSFVLRIDEATFAALEKWAADEFRSVNGHVEWLISNALKEAGREIRQRKTAKPKEEQ